MNRWRKSSLRLLLIAAIIMALVVPTVFAQDNLDHSMLGDSGAALGLSLQRSAFGGPYTIELQRWGIDGTPENNSKGINNALTWASQQGYQTIIFPAQEYIISETHPISIRDMRGVTIDLNGAVIRINTNGLRSNKMITMDDCRNVQLINGTIQGDIKTHDYTTNPGTTEGNLGIEIRGGCVDCTLDNLTVKDITGWGIVLSRGKDYAGNRHYVSKTNLKTGGIDLATGGSVADSSKISTINPIEISEFNTFEEKYFILGVDKGYSGYPYLSAKSFDVVFYDGNKQIISSLQNQPVYKKIAIPDQVAYADFAFYQSNLPTKGDGDFGGAVIFISHHIQPGNLHIINSTIDNCRSLGMAICGGDDVTIQNCTIKNTKDLAPGYAVDMEDGWEYMNEIKFIDNVFENNPKDVVVCAGDNTTFQGNRFGGVVYIWERATNLRFEGNTFENTFSWPVQAFYECSKSVVSTGNTYINFGIMVYKKKPDAQITFDNEHFYNSNINRLDEGVEVTNSTIESDRDTAVRLSGTLRNCTIDIVNGEFISSTMYQCSIKIANVMHNQLNNLYDGCTITDSDFATTGNTGTITVKNSKITDTTFSVSTWANKTTLDIQNCTITMEQTGKPLVNFSAGKMENLVLNNNTIVNHTSQPVLKMFDTIYTVPNATITLINNRIEQTYPYVFDGVKLSGGAVRVTDVGNTIVGSATMHHPSYAENPSFTVSHTIPSGNTGNLTNSGSSGSSGYGGGGGFRGGADTAALPAVNDSKELTLTKGTALFNTASKPTNGTVILKLQNYSVVKKATAQGLQKLAAGKKLPLILSFYQVEKGVTLIRYTVDVSQINSDLKLFPADQGKSIKTQFEKQFANRLDVYHVGGKSIQAKIAVKLPPSISADKLVLYRYDIATKTVQVVPEQEIAADSKGYVHFDSKGSEVFVCAEGMLVKK